MEVQQVLHFMLVLGIGAASANWLMVIALLGVALQGSGSKISKQRRTRMDNDALLVAILAGIGVGVALAVFVAGNRWGADVSAIRIITGVVSGIMGVIVPLYYARTLNRFYFRRAKQNLESGLIAEALEDAGEVYRSSPDLKYDARRIEAACYFRLGDIDRARQMMVEDGCSGEEIQSALQTMKLQYPPLNPDDGTLASNGRQGDDDTSVLEFKHLRGAKPRPDYRPSGRVSAIRLLRWSVLGGVAATAIGVTYSMATIWSNYVKLNGLIVFVAALLVGALASAINRLGHVRNRPIGYLVAFLLAGVALYAAWAAHFVYYVMALTGATLAEVQLPTPTVLCDWCGWLLRNGLWGMNQNQGPLTGWPLLCMWIVEALAIIVSSVVVVHHRDSDRMYCESCGCWMRYQPQTVTLPTRRSDQAIERIKQGDLSAIMQMGIDRDQHERLSMKLCLCPQCDESRCLEINETTQKVVEGQTMDVETRLAGPLPITGDEERELRALAAELMELTAELTAERYSLDEPATTA